MTIDAQRGDFAPFQLGGCPLPWLVCHRAQDGTTVIEAATGLPVVRWRTNGIVPAPGVKAGAR